MQGLTPHQKKFLLELNKKKKEQYFKIENIKIKVNPGVFPPATDSKLLAKNLKGLKNLSVLDITSGSGLFSVIAGLQGAKSLAIDINPLAIENIKQNFNEYSLKFNIIKSDLFTNIPKQKFDLIIANGPFSEGKPKEWIEYAMLGYKNFISTFFKNSPKYLKKTGFILLVNAGWTEQGFLHKTIIKNGFIFSIIDKMKSQDKKREYLLYKIKFQ
jgi:HemK-related putative methylase